MLKDKSCATSKLFILTDYRVSDDEKKYPDIVICDGFKYSELFSLRAIYMAELKAENEVFHDAINVNGSIPIRTQIYNVFHFLPCSNQHVMH